MTRTWPEQKAHEAAERKAWLQSLIDSGMTQTEAAEVCGINRNSLARIMKSHGLSFPPGPWSGTTADKKAVFSEMTRDELNDYRVMRRKRLTRAEALAALGYEVAA